MSVISLGNRGRNSDFTRNNGKMKDGLLHIVEG